MRNSARKSKGFVFLAVLGVMAVALLIAFAISSSTQFSYRQTGISLLDVQEQLMARTAADYALALLAQKKMAADGKPQPFAFTSDQRTKSTVEGNIEVTPAAPDQPVYKLTALTPRPGDVVVHVFSEAMFKRSGRGERYFLCNTAGGRARPIDVTAAFIGKLAR